MMLFSQPSLTGILSYCMNHMIKCSSCFCHTPSGTLAFQTSIAQFELAQKPIIQRLSGHNFKKGFLHSICFIVTACTSMDFCYYSILKYSRNRQKSFVYLAIVGFFALYISIYAFVKSNTVFHSTLNSWTLQKRCVLLKRHDYLLWWTVR